MTKKAVRASKLGLCLKNRGDLLASVRRIHATFAEHCSLTFQQWEEGFRRDADPQREIARCVHAVNVYTTFTQDESDPVRREDVFRTVVACLTASPDSVWHVLQTQCLTGVRPARHRPLLFRPSKR